VNRNLVEFFAEFMYFLKRADDSVMAPETVEAYWEEIGFRLDRFSESERLEFARILDDLADEAADEPDRAAFYRGFFAS
jgi:hypothetical protein